MRSIEAEGAGGPARGSDQCCLRPREVSFGRAWRPFSHGPFIPPGDGSEGIRTLTLDALIAIARRQEGRFRLFIRVTKQVRQESDGEERGERLRNGESVC